MKRKKPVVAVRCRAPALSCSYPLCSRPEAARAIDNVPRYGHLCARHYAGTVHWQPHLAAHYVEIRS